MHGKMDVKFFTARMYTLYISSVSVHKSPISHSFAEAPSRPKNAINCIIIEYRRGIAAITGYVADHSRYTTNASRAEYSGTNGLQAPMLGRAIWRQNRSMAKTYVNICIFILILTCKKSSNPPGWPRLTYKRVQHAYTIPDRTMYGISLGCPASYTRFHPVIMNSVSRKNNAGSTRRSERNRVLETANWNSSSSSFSKPSRGPTVDFRPLQTRHLPRKTLYKHNMVSVKAK